jgi:hypothetical protein
MRAKPYRHRLGKSLENNRIYRPGKKAGGDTISLVESDSGG